MPMTDYTPGQVWKILTEGSEVPEEEADVRVGLGKLSSRQSIFLNLLANGWTGKSAMRAAGLMGNQTRNKREAIMELTRLING
jgi:hypothetical protein